jgi:hypothetical protein
VASTHSARTTLGKPWASTQEVKACGYNNASVSAQFATWHGIQDIGRSQYLCEKKVPRTQPTAKRIEGIREPPEGNGIQRWWTLSFPFSCYCVPCRVELGVVLLGHDKPSDAAVVRNSCCSISIAAQSFSDRTIRPRATNFSAHFLLS